MKTNHQKKQKTEQLMVPEKTPLLDAICKVRNQRIDKNDEQAVLGMYERNWILNNHAGVMSKAERGFLRKLSNKYGSWLNNYL